MTTHFLLPHKFKYVGLVVFLIGIVFSILVEENAAWLNCQIIAPIITEWKWNGESMFFQPYNANFRFTIIGILLITGCLFIAFSKEKAEDEFINLLRLKAFQLAVLTNSVILFLCCILVWEFAFLNVMVYNLFSTLILFILIFHYLLLKTKNFRKNEE
jgi:hypothetical protein